MACLQPALIELEEGVARTLAERHSTTPLRSPLPRVSYPPLPLPPPPPLLSRHPFDVKAGETISFLSTLRDSLSSSPSTISEHQRALSFVEDVVTGSNRAQFTDFLGIMTFALNHTFPRSSINYSNFVVLQKYK